MNVKRVGKATAKLTALKYFPSDPDARAAIVEIVCSMCQDEDKAEWLIGRALQVFNEWPGPKTLRALYCRRWRPGDGVEAYTTDDERERWESLPDPGCPQIEGPKTLMLPAGKDEPIHDPVMKAVMEIAVNIQGLKDASWAGTKTNGGREATPEEIASAPRWLRELEGYE